MNTPSGFTTIEVMALVLFVVLLGVIGYDRYGAVQSVHRDQSRKVAINTIHHNLEEVVRPKLGGYPRVLQASQLTAMDKALLIDPCGLTVNEKKSTYRYEPTGCNGGDICSGYTLRADLEKEADYIKAAGNG